MAGTGTTFSREGKLDDCPSADESRAHVLSSALLSSLVHGLQFGGDSSLRSCHFFHLHSMIGLYLLSENSKYSIQSTGRRTTVRITKLKFNSTVNLRLKIWTTKYWRTRQSSRKWPFCQILEIFSTQNYG